MFNYILFVSSKVWLDTFCFTFCRFNTGMFVHASICYIIVGFSQLKYCSPALINKQYLNRDDLYIS